MRPWLACWSAAVLFEPYSAENTLHVVPLYKQQHQPAIETMAEEEGQLKKVRGFDRMGHNCVEDII